MLPYQRERARQQSARRIPMGAFVCLRVFVFVFVCLLIGVCVCVLVFVMCVCTCACV